MRPSETRRGQAWLTNFHQADVETATVLLDSLRFLSLNEIHTKLRDFLDRALHDKTIPFPALILPERNLRSYDELAVRFQGLRDPSDDSADADTVEWSEFASSVVAWQDFLPGDGLKIATAGSDAFVGMVLARYSPTDGHTLSADRRWIMPHASIDDLRGIRCRSVVVLADYVASGRQSESLASAIARNPTIRSWRSLHLVSIHVAAIAAQQSGVERLKASKAVDSVHTVEVAPSIWTTIRDADAQNTVVELCRSYAKKARLALGYDDAGGLLVTERRAPNNLPGVFIQDARDWKPLFPRREVPQDFVDQLRDYRPSEDLQTSALRVGQIRLGQNERVQSLRKASRVLLQALALVNAGAIEAIDIAEPMGVDVHEAAAYLATLQDWGLVDQTGQISDDGRRELAAGKRGRRWTTAHLEGSSEPYYPLALR
jgi:hypothetical protein